MKLKLNPGWWRSRKFTTTVVVFFAGVLIWFVWCHQQEKKIVRLENAVWVGGDNHSAFKDVEQLTGVRYTLLLPPNLQARRCGLLGDWFLVEGNYDRAMVHYFIEFLYHYGAQFSRSEIVDLWNHPDQVQSAIVEVVSGEGEVVIPVPNSSTDMSELTDRISPILTKDNAYYELSKLPEFSNAKDTGQYLNTKQGLAKARLFLETNRDVAEAWDSVSKRYDYMRQPLGEKGFIRLDHLANFHSSQFRIALADGDDFLTLNSLMRLYQTVELMESDGGLVFALVAISTRKQLIEYLSSVEFSSALKMPILEIVERYPIDPKILSLIAPREISSSYHMAFSDDYFNDVTETLEGSKERLAYEFKEALYLHWLELDSHFTGAVTHEYVLPRAEPVLLQEYKVARRGFYWREPHAQLSGYKEGQVLISEGVIKSSAGIMAVIAVPNAKKIREVVLGVGSDEQSLVLRLRQTDDSDLSVVRTR